MRRLNIKSISKFWKLFSVFSIAVLLISTHVANSATIYPAGSLLQPNDVTSSHIRNNTILDIDINTGASISATKINPGSANGNIIFSNSGALSTSTSLAWYNGTTTLRVAGNIDVTGTTTFNGVDYIWPSSMGTNGQLLQTNGSKNLTWASAGNSKMTATFYAGENITAGDAVALGTNTTVTYGNANAGSGTTNVSTSVLSSGFYFAVATTSPNPVAQVTAVIMSFRNQPGGTEATTLEVTVMADSAGSPGPTVLGTKTLSTTVANGCGQKTFTFDSPINITAGTTYWFSFRETEGAGSPIPCPNDTGSGLTWKTSNDNLNWSAGNTTAGITATWVTVSGQSIYRTNATSNDYRANNFIGFAPNSITAGSSGTIDIGGITSAATTTTAGTVYYLSNTAGQIGTSAGAQSRKVGIGIGNIGFMIRHDNP